MAGWVVKLAGNDFDLSALTKVATAPECQVTKDDGAYYLASTDFAAMQEPGEVHALATTTLLPRINGLMKLRNLGYQPVSLDSVIRLNADGSRTHARFVVASVLLSGNSRITAEGTVTDPDGTVVPSPEPARFQARLKLARQDADVRRALSFWRACDATDPNFWWNAYKVYEVIRDDLAAGRDKGEGTKEMTARGWATSSEIQNFKESANNRDISGEKARHAEEQPRKPGTSALNEREGLAIIQHLLDCWLTEKAHQAGLGTP